MIYGPKLKCELSVVFKMMIDLMHHKKWKPIRVGIKIKKQYLAPEMNWRGTLII